MLYSALVVLYYCITLLVCFRIVIDTPNQSKALGYLFLVTFFPIIGIVIYFSVGVNYRKEKLYQKKLLITGKEFKNLQNEIDAFIHANLTENKANLDYFFPLAKSVAEESISTGNNTVELLVNGEDKFKKVLESLKRAKYFIHIEYYIYENDTIGNQIAEILIEKAKQGVKVRFIYDDFGSSKIRGSFIKKLQNAGVETAPFYKIKLHLLINRINYRNHRKIIVVDGTVGYIGGINVSDRYINPNKFNLFWRDSHLKIEGVSVLNLQRIFIADWNFCAQQSLSYSPALFPYIEDKKFGESFTQITASGPDSEYPNIMFALIQAIALSRKEILITTPYFIPEKSFIDALIIAKKSNVDVNILVPGISDSFIVNTASSYYYEELLKAGINIYLYQKGFVHAKTMVCDEFVSIVGTANLDQRSFDLNFEVNTIVYEKELALEMKKEFLHDVENSIKLELDVWKQRPYYKKLFESILRLFSPLM